MEYILADRINRYSKIMETLENKVNRFIFLTRSTSSNMGDDLNTIIFKRYIQLSDVRKVAEDLNRLGLRIKTNTYVGERKYLPKDITNILNTKDLSIDDELYEAVDLMRQLDKLLSQINLKKVSSEK